MSDTTQYIQFGFVTITAANLAVVGLLVLVFVLAVLLRPPSDQQIPILGPQRAQGTDGTDGTDGTGGTGVAGSKEQP